MPRTAARSARVEARLPPATLDVVRRAAELQGRSVSEFVVAAAEEAARRALNDAFVVDLAPDEQARLADVLLGPPPPTPAFERARASHRRLFGPPGDAT